MQLASKPWEMTAEMTAGGAWVARRVDSGMARTSMMHLQRFVADQIPSIQERIHQLRQADHNLAAAQGPHSRALCAL